MGEEVGEEVGGGEETGGLLDSLILSGRRNLKLLLDLSLSSTLECFTFREARTDPFPLWKLVGTN